MIKRLFVGLGHLVQARGPVWLNGWYWVDRLVEWRDGRGPKRSTSRSRVVRYLKGMYHSLGAVGWTWAILAIVGTLWATYGRGVLFAWLVMLSVWAGVRAGMTWSRRMHVWTVEWAEDCPNCFGEDDL